MHTFHAHGTRGQQQGSNVLISGASFAGLTTAYWMNRLGYRVTVVEIGKSLKMGGTPVNIEGGTVDIMQRMGLLEHIRNRSLPVRPVEFLDSQGNRAAVMAGQGSPYEKLEIPEYEIERDDLLRMQFEKVSNDVEFVFDDCIERMEDSKDEVRVFFKSGAQRAFSLVFGCDGDHSSVRKMCFGEETAYTHFLQMYFSITIVDKLLIAQDTTQIFNVPGKTVMMNAYHGKTDIAFAFFSEEEIPYDYRDRCQQRQIILEHFHSEGWRVPELLDEMRGCKDFYFDKLCQIKMPSWTKGRVALVGDAAYCASPAAGMGGSLAIIGAAALGDAFEKHPHDFEAAFWEYNHSLRPFIDKVQADAVEFGLETFAPKSEESIRERNARFRER
jgi:2-polyprenyl-6-methoxyphenol hydroxylase-like FAD-dependent oxidoreductase